MSLIIQRQETNKTGLHLKWEVCYIKNVTWLHEESQLTMTVGPACSYCEILHDKVSRPVHNLVPLTGLPNEQRIAHGIQLGARGMLSSPSLPLFIPFSFPNGLLLPLSCVNSYLAPGSDFWGRKPCQLAQGGAGGPPQSFPSIRHLPSLHGLWNVTLSERSAWSPDSPFLVALGTHKIIICVLTWCLSH